MFLKKKLFDETVDDNLQDRRVLGGSSTNINNFNKIKYAWTVPLYRRMVSNYWIPEIIPMTSDKMMYRSGLAFEEKDAFNETLSFLVFLDSIQATALPSVADFITAPEISRIITLQAFQEIIHSQAYSYILESICEPEEIHAIYYRFKENENLLKRCRQLTDLYSEFRNNPNDRNLAIMFLASLMLEGILFFNGFYFFYSLAYNEKMTNCADEIRLINRDENEHLAAFIAIVNNIKEENPGFFTQELVDLVVTPIVLLEKEWAGLTYGNGILGITLSTISDSVDHRSNLVCDAIGFKSPFPNKPNPYTHLDAIGTDDGSMVKTGFFETRLTSYDFATTMSGWEDI